MTNENQPQFERDLAQSAEPEEFNGGQVEPINDPSLSLKTGLENLFLKYSRIIEKQLKDGLIDEEKANELTTRIDHLSLRDIGYEASKGVPLEMAKEILGPDMFFGPDEVKFAGIEIKEEIPPIPFSSAELKRAQELGQMLIYRTSTTLKELNDTISPQLETEVKGELFCLIDQYAVGDSFKSEKIRPGWALVSKELIPDSEYKRYHEQSELLAEYLQNEVFKGKPLPHRYQQAIDELNAQIEYIRRRVVNHRVVNHDDNMRTRITSMIANLKINYLFRPSPAEVVYDFIVNFQNTGERLHESDSVLTSTRYSGGQLVSVSYIDAKGFCVAGIKPINWDKGSGVSFSRRGADLTS